MYIESFMALKVYDSVIQKELAPQFQTNNNGWGKNISSGTSL